MPDIPARFSRWTIVESAPAIGRRARWLCRCDCGTDRVVTQSDLTSGKSQSCGCLKRDQPRGRHGMRHSAEYRVWSAMRTRCSNPKANNFHNYGGRGIRVCDRWNLFENFYADIGARPSPSHSIDRIENDGNYEPGNVRWATRQQQNRNQRRWRRAA